MDFKEPLRGHDDAREDLQCILAAAGSVYRVQDGSPPYLARVVGLGTVIGDLRNAPDKWKVPLHGSTRDDQVAAFTAMLELLWNGQSDRHDSPDLMHAIYERITVARPGSWVSG